MTLFWGLLRRSQHSDLEFEIDMILQINSFWSFQRGMYTGASSVIDDVALCSGIA